MKTLSLDLMNRVIKDFVPRYVREPNVFDPTNDTDLKNLSALGVSIQNRDWLPDLVILDGERDWLFLIDSVPNRSYITESRMAELNDCVAQSDKHVVFFSAFADRESFSPHAEWIPWGTHVWIADAPDHMIHFNGERFLGPYGK